jgi:hypothetical protein
VGLGELTCMKRVSSVLRYPFSIDLLYVVNDIFLYIECLSLILV